MVDLYRGYDEGLLTEEPTRFSDMYPAAATGLLFAPGGGVTDIMGGAPDPSRPGEYLPSFSQNIAGKEYIDAAMQAAGGAGDVLMAMTPMFPPAAAAGAALKAPRAARVAEMGRGGVLSQVGEAEMLSAPQSYGAGGSPLTKDALEKADDTTKLLVSRILEANPDAALGLVRSGSAAGDSNYLTLKTPDGRFGQVRISDHGTGTARLFDYIDQIPMKIPPEGKQVFGQISRKSFDDRINKIVDLMTPRPATDDLERVLQIRADQMAMPSSERTQPSGQSPLFDTSPESYERTAQIMEQKETPVPRQAEGAKLPLGDRARVVMENQDVIATRLAERMKPYLGTPAQYFYHTGPLLEKAKELGVSEQKALQQISRFAENYAATSPRTMTEQNLRNASLVAAKQEAGIPLTDVIGPGSGGINEKGYPMMIGPGGIHGLLVDAVRQGGIDYSTNPKPATFAENVKGNLQGVTVDTHAVRGALDAMNEAMPGSVPKKFIKPEFHKKYEADPSSLDPATMIIDTLGSQKVSGEKMQTEYAVFSDIYKLAAEKLGVTPAEAQSLGWFGSGNRTGLASELKTVVDLIDERVDVTSQLLGESKEKVYKDFLSGKIPLLSIPVAGLLGAGMAREERPQPAGGIL